MRVLLAALRRVVMIPALAVATVICGVQLLPSPPFGSTDLPGHSSDPVKPRV